MLAFDENNVGLCKPCGPYFLSPIDATTKPSSGATMGLAIATYTADRYYFVEHRTDSTSGNAALISCADVQADGGETGVWGNSVLADCTPKTSDWFDAGCSPGMSIVLDIGRHEWDSRKITVSVKEVRHIISSSRMFVLCLFLSRLTRP